MAVKPGKSAGTQQLLLRILFIGGKLQSTLMVAERQAYPSCNGAVIARGPARRCRRALPNWSEANAWSLPEQSLGDGVAIEALQPDDDEIPLFDMPDFRGLVNNLFHVPIAELRHRLSLATGLQETTANDGK